ncbi:MAG: glucose-6-phosphate isomerase [Alphaproteobacteria bacterium]|nr:glucose-6-phosphate isomerase [Alphaproteobacteria bacterium]MBT4711535.1 glucose-6-phosphate isomerase [Alphaproteobacteria bacterium]
MLTNPKYSVASGVPGSEVVFPSAMSDLFSHNAAQAFPADLPDREKAEVDFARNIAAMGPALEKLRSPSDPELAAVLAVPRRRDDLAEMQEIAQDWRDRFDEILILGTGGSSLGGRALTALAPTGQGPRLRFLDNLDPHTFDAVLAELSPDRTGVLVISKSGGTAETLTQVLPIADAFSHAGLTNPSDHFLTISDPGTSPLRSWAAAAKIRCLDHEPALGGRLSVLSNVGLLPALIAGMDAMAVREGADQVLQNLLAARDPGEMPPVIGAALSVALMKACGISSSVLWVYADRLQPFALWYRQIWAESLGKNGQGSTPLDALGPLDQHSQLQLYLDGPEDKVFTFLMLDVKGTGPRVPEASAAAIGSDYLGGATAGDLISAHQHATAETLAANGRPTRVIEIPRLDEKAMGGLFMHFMLETILAAHLLGVTPFDQPAVEASKVLARKTLSGEVDGTPRENKP